MKYKQLQELAKEKNLPYVGVSKADLEASLNITPEETDEVTEKSDTPLANTTEAKTTEKVDKPNAAVVMEKNREVRRYTQELHGSKFSELAQEFSSTRGYTVNFETVKPGILCPSCGHKFNPKN